MSKLFFVVGLPRTRSAWLANLFTTERSVCLHDAMRDCRCSEDLVAHLESSGREYAGASGSDLVFIYDRVRALRPDAVWTTIVRDPGESRRAFEVAFPGALRGPQLDTAFEALAEFLPSEPPRVRFDELDSEAVVRSIWQRSMPTIPFDPARFSLLREFKVTRRGNLPTLVDNHMVGHLMNELLRPLPETT